MQRQNAKLGTMLLTLGSLAGCAHIPPTTTSCRCEQPAKSSASTSAPAAPAPSMRPASWADLPGWRDDDLAQLWPSFLATCGAKQRPMEVESACTAANGLEARSNSALRDFFQEHFEPRQVLNADGREQGLITGYYEPVLRGSRYRTGAYQHPVYRPPADLLVIDLARLYPELKGMRLRGRLEGNRVVPYAERSVIDAPSEPLRGREILWLDDEVEVFMLHIQGSGRVRLPSGEMVRLGYAEQNGHPYRAIGRKLIEDGSLQVAQVDLASIKAWLRAHPERTREILNSNPSYVFFRESPDSPGGPLGSLGVGLTAGRSIAVDPKYVALGLPVYLDSTWPNGTKPLQQLVMAQDTGGAIKSAVRADLFWGTGESAERLAGAMKQSGRMWLLVPRVAPAK